MRLVQTGNAARSVEGFKVEEGSQKRHGPRGVERQAECFSAQRSANGEIAGCGDHVKQCLGVFVWGMAWPAGGATPSRLPPFSESDPHHDISDLHLVQSYFPRFRPTSLHESIQKPPKRFPVPSLVDVATISM